MKNILILFAFLSLSAAGQITTGKFGAYNWMASIPPGSGKLPAFILTTNPF